MLRNGNEIEEGFLNCHNCNLVNPIIKKIPIIWKDFENYISMRPSVGGELMLSCTHNKTKKFIKKSLFKIHANNDQNNIEKRWAKIYRKKQKH